MPEPRVLFRKHWTGIPADCSFDKRWGMDLRQSKGKTFEKQRQTLRIFRGMLMDLLWPNISSFSGAELVDGGRSVEPKDQVRQRISWFGKCRVSDYALLVGG
jgi:hypothetical protein